MGLVYFTYIWLIFMVKFRWIYTIHGGYGLGFVDPDLKPTRLCILGIGISQQMLLHGSGLSYVRFLATTEKAFHPIFSPEYSGK